MKVFAEGLDFRDDWNHHRAAVGFSVEELAGGFLDLRFHFVVIVHQVKVFRNQPFYFE